MYNEPLWLHVIFHLCYIPKAGQHGILNLVCISRLRLSIKGMGFSLCFLNISSSFWGLDDMPHNPPRHCLVGKLRSRWLKLESHLKRTQQSHRCGDEGLWPCHSVMLLNYIEGMRRNLCILHTDSFSDLFILP